ncbi:hypothetical protein ACW6QP_14305 [Salegentibacter sp. HM20]
MDNIKLIDGKFSANEAKEILLNMISSKIQFHTIKDFSSEIRTGEPENNSQKRMKELGETRERIITLLDDAQKNNLVVEIQSTINISCRAESRTEKV